MDDKLLEAYCRKEEIRWQEHSKQHKLEQRAVSVASDALTKRLEGMNEIRDQRAGFYFCHEGSTGVEDGGSGTAAT
uniref:Uncharacterized protein n=1 Tax=viral metagenome TaxID=1070528 RepID=A0A6M3IVX1_9ZZZZ